MFYYDLEDVPCVCRAVCVCVCCLVLLFCLHFTCLQLSTKRNEFVCSLLYIAVIFICGTVYL